jgi:hypothetical protein
MEDRALTVIDNQTPPAQVDVVASAMTPDSVVRQVNLVQNVMQRVMKKGTHYDTIPGTPNPTLLKPGAEKLSMTFRFAPSYKITRYDLPDGHREYEVVCNIETIESGQFLGSGVGSATTMERKYRYRSESTGKPVPGKYWNSKDPELLGGSRFKAQKRGGKWVIVEQVEHDNPADYYNTVLKMAKKRAFVDAVLTVTAASDIFTQDVEDLDDPQLERAEPKQNGHGRPAPVNTAKPAGRLLNEVEKGEFDSKMNELGLNPAKVLLALNSAGFGLASLADLTRDRLDMAYQIMEAKAGLAPAKDRQGDGMFDNGEEDDIPW